MEPAREAKVTAAIDPSMIDEAALAELVLDDARESLATSRAAIELLEQRVAGRIE